MPRSGFVVIAGRPNAGKSTLLNQLLEMQLSIVSPKAQTTRENIVGVLNASEGQICFIDTPGIHFAKEGGINEFMIHQAQSALESPNLVWYLLDPFSTLKAEKKVIETLQGTRCPVFLIQNKSDIAQKTGKKAEELLSFVQQELKDHQIPLSQTFKISALKNQGIKELLKSTWQEIPEGPLYYPDVEQVTDRPMRFFAAELIREQLFLQLGEEVPYSCAVEITRYDESVKPIRIEANVYVERDSQKGILIGASASKIKNIGQKARESIEKMLGAKIFLGLQVKILKDWSKNEETLKRLGYTS